MASTTVARAVSGFDQSNGMILTPDRGVIVA